MFIISALSLIVNICHKKYIFTAIMLYKKSYVIISVYSKKKQKVLFCQDTWVKRRFMICVRATFLFSKSDTAQMSQGIKRVENSATEQRGREPPGTKV